MRNTPQLAPRRTVGVTALVLVGLVATPLLADPVWFGRHETRDHVIDLFERVDGSTTYIDIKYDSELVGSPKFTRNAQNELVYVPGEWEGYPGYEDCNGIVRLSFWYLDEEITPLYFAISDTRAELPPSGTIYTSPSTIY